MDSSSRVVYAQKMDAELERLVSDLRKVEVARSIRNIETYLAFIDGLVSRLPEPNVPLQNYMHGVRPHPIHTLALFKAGGIIKIMPTTADAVLRHYLKWGKDRYSMLGLKVEEEPFDDYFRRELEEAGVQYRNHGVGPLDSSRRGHPYNNLHEISYGGEFLKTCFQGPVYGGNDNYYREWIKLLDKKSFLNLEPESWYNNHRSGNFRDASKLQVQPAYGGAPKGEIVQLTTYNELNTMHPWETDLDYAGRVLTCIEKRLLAIVEELEYADKFNNWILLRQPYERRAFNPAAGTL